MTLRDQYLELSRQFSRGEIDLKAFHQKRMELGKVARGLDPNASIGCPPCVKAAQERAKKLSENNSPSTPN